MDIQCCPSSFQQTMWLDDCGCAGPTFGHWSKEQQLFYQAALLAPFRKRLQAHLALIQNGSLTVSADRAEKMQQHCATHFKVGGTIWNISFTCTNRHWSQRMLVCLHSEMLSPTILYCNLHDWQSFTVILLISSSHICLLSLLSSVNCVSQFTRLFQFQFVLRVALH